MPKTINTNTTTKYIVSLTLNGKTVTDPAPIIVEAPLTQEGYEKAVRAAFRRAKKGGLEYWTARKNKKADKYSVALSESATDADKKAFEEAKTAAEAAHDARSAAKKARREEEAAAKAAENEAREKAKAAKKAEVAASKGASALFGGDNSGVMKALEILSNPAFGAALERIADPRFTKTINVLSDKLGIE